MKHVICKVSILLTFVLHPLGIKAHEQVQASHFQAIADTIKKFHRRITVLEIGGKEAAFTSLLSTTYNTVCVAMLLEGGADRMTDHVKHNKVSNITILAPYGADLESLVTLGRCEHFDVVIVHDVHSLIKTVPSKLIDAYVTLGDSVFIKTSSPAFEQELKKRRIKRVAQCDRGSLYLSSRQKTSLDIARFSQKDRPINHHPKYHIKSDAHQKFFSKKGLEEPTRWVDGINLVTFAMLKGVYPEDMSIRKQLSAMNRKHSDHNDLVLGNIIVQGNKLIPIDFNDSRRSADAQKCVTAALKAFKTGNIRHRNPERWMKEYYDMV